MSKKKSVFLLIDNIGSGLNSSVYEDLTGEPNIHVISKSYKKCKEWKLKFKKGFGFDFVIVKSFDKKFQEVLDL